MKTIVVSVFDKAASVYGRPVFAAAEGIAVRSFRDEVNRAERDNTMNQHPADFDLYVIGAFDDVTGELEPCRPRLVLNGMQVVDQKPLELSVRR